MFHAQGEEIFKIKIFYFFFLFDINVAVRLPGKGVPSASEMPYYYSKQGDDQWLHNGFIALEAVSICFLSQLKTSARRKIK